ncbi:UDP-4-amino-4,6-dideoxy-N-acetyl-beta-L-altrosamine transaminase [Candidatus Giovannonibacteria bacterium RIFCSPLOWO2_12_FULL_44_25]|uniref:UDP-4-keto-6-deoxy-N-acetylglucosamine 4-aminotransferase n=3 Tax=Parcubacteria group TaxID=1794811 RepID=A0A837IH21_9BACT|nr:MAG: UDP-4-keto-6-deoxy-N-acetylglucosamine 4-aminotransferase [Parcubacteria group bacterium GW2011_GWC1_44_10]KKT60396.1 MAG: UDP-4-keto-6-deoxy-N-acetylglucosamine 4-aminotransferase [Candidatus Giovannonibacteria bacterium GW2011_GWA1_44_25]KKU12666.1 MAG: UDP-4-keto-6-deoxy-N-acetylglucosamine 4-aminotransferase [Candidatus Azambacteria bacterium GW2011_GWC2_45_7b]KKU30254.1 MAG: UDP-4-keto-6-deoxy-N-acetylglucosamine 4-aminotransferase [Candidatus Giovannonibacteria bacterium GW2011_GWB
MKTTFSSRRGGIVAKATIPYGHQSIDNADIEAVKSVLKSDWLTQGPKIGEFERALAHYCGAKFAAAFSSGTAALHAAYFVAGMRRGDEFITTPLTFAATSNAGLYLGARPVFADIDEYGNLDPVEAEKKITRKTKLLAVVDYAGHPANLDKFKSLARKRKLVLIEDAAHSLGAKYKGKKIGSIADMTTFSFHPVKSITTGEGGAVATNSKIYYEKLKQFRHHGIGSRGMQMLGFNYRLTDIHAALGISQLKKLDKFISARKKIASRYGEAIRQNKNLLLPEEHVGVSSSWHLYPLRFAGKSANKRAEIVKKLRNAGIGAQIHYIPVYLHPYYQKLGYKKGLCPKAEAFYEAEISLPIFPSLKNTEQNFVIKTLIKILKST